VRRPSCDGLPGNELSRREGEDKFQTLDVSAVVAAKGVIKGERGIYVIPYCDRLPVDELSHTECLDKFQPIDVLDVCGVVAAKGFT
jgi:hypothetical protein